MESFPSWGFGAILVILGFLSDFIILAVRQRRDATAYWWFKAGWWVKGVGVWVAILGAIPAGWPRALLVGLTVFTLIVGYAGYKSRCAPPQELS